MMVMLHSKISLMIAVAAFLLLSRISAEEDLGRRYKWEPAVFNFNIKKGNVSEGIPSSTVLVDQPLYVSIATIHSRIK